MLIQNRFYVKIGFILALITLLMIPRLMLDSLIGERENWRRMAYSSIEQSWPGKQTLGGPVVAVPYQLFWTVSEKITDGGERTVTREANAAATAYLLPSRLDVESGLETATRYRGIYEIPVFTGSVQLSGEFSTQRLLDIETENSGKRIVWGQPQVCVLLSDQRGIVRAEPLQWAGQACEFKPGSGIGVAAGGMHARIPQLDTREAGTFPFSLKMELQGMQSMQYALLAENNDIHLTANWPHPGFFGDMLPETREIGDKGFTARWRSSTFSSNGAEALAALQKKEGGNLLRRTVGVNFVQPVDVYQQSERSIKYALLFLTMTFACMVLFELLRKTPLHPVQYTLVGCALLVFYLLLIALSEHVSFAWAYLAATLACTGLLTAYFGAILRSRRHGLFLGAGLSSLYALLYVILQSEDNALVMGSVLVFAVLAALMLGTRSFDWYALTARPMPPAEKQPPQFTLEDR